MALVTALAVGCGGAAGAVARSAVADAVEHRAVDTLAVNVVGSFLLGVVLGAGVGGSSYLVVAVGFCGAFTTFSSFAVETVRLAEDVDTAAAVYNAVANLTLALGAVLAGTVGGGLA